ncbi:MAG: hypothetical protein IJ364_07860 [Oscillospiraceae bacterium]|nr:hypothetical protein [Oscillospiraceae bacterium]
MGVHDGHRKRLRARFIEHNLNSFNDINSLELLLSFAIPRKDTNELAHALIDRFGSLKAVFEASHQELLEIDGIGENAAVLISLVPQIYKKAAVCIANEKKVLNNERLLAEYLMPRFLNEIDEVFYMLCLDNKCTVIKCVELSRGTADYVDTNIRKVVETAITSRASFIVIAHNHPRGPVTPSIEDDEVTRRIFRALKSVSIKLVDQLIFTGENYFSYVKYGRINVFM